METEHKSNARELSEQELEQASGAGNQGSWSCECGNTEYRTVYHRGPAAVGGRLPYRKCTKCGREKLVSY